MRIAITGGTGFVGRHLARRLMDQGHHVVLVARGIDRRDSDVFGLPHAEFFASDLASADALVSAFAGCDAVAHCAGINREIGQQTYEKVHVRGTRNVVEAAQRAGVRKLVLLSFLRARPDCGSPYHESKWQAEEIVRVSGLDYTIFKSGMVYGRGDHMLDHLSHSLHTVPLFATVGLREKPIRPLAVDDLVVAMAASFVDTRLSRQTVAITGAEELKLSDAVRRVGRVLHKRVLVIPAPLWLQYLLAQTFEMTMRVPLIAKAQVRILAEGVIEVAPPCSELPLDLAPVRFFTDEQIRRGLPPPGAFGLRDLRMCHSR